MDFSSYLDLDDPDGPRVKGHRIWLNQVLHEVVFNHRTAEQLLERFDTLTMEQIYACLLYFEQNRQACLRKLVEDLDRSRRNFLRHGGEWKEKKQELLRRRLQQQGRQVGPGAA